MAFKSVLLCVFVLVILLSTQAEGNNSFKLGMASKALSHKGYHAMSMIFDVFFKTQSVSEWLVHGNSTLTVFCPPDQAFFSSKYEQPPLTLLQYHVVPQKLDSSEDLISLPHGSKIDTLLLGHPLVVTTLPMDVKAASLNGVKVTEWDLYNDGGLIVHGVDNFFDPAFQTLIYPWLDVNNDIHVEQVVSGFSWQIRELTDNRFLLMVMVAIGLSLLMLSFCCCDEEVEYECILQEEEEKEEAKYVLIKIVID